MNKMKSNLTAYKNWAPDGIVWTAWVKPVLFASPLPVTTNAKKEDDSLFEVNIPHVNADDFVFEVKKPAVDWTKLISKDAAIILDLPGKEGVEEGMALARLGCRPVPLYNGTYHYTKSKPIDEPTYVSLYRDDVYIFPRNHENIVNSLEIAEALFANADELPSLNIDDDAPPVFMLDSNRDGNDKFASHGDFDNRWCVFKQDMPSAAFLKKQGIKKILVYTPKINYDLDHILYAYQQQGIVIRHFDGNHPAKLIRVSKPNDFKNILYRLKVICGLKYNAAGGFGQIIPDPSTSTGSG